MKVRIFLIPLCIAFPVPKILVFLCLRKIGEIKLHKTVGNLLDISFDN